MNAFRKPLFIPVVALGVAFTFTSGVPTGLLGPSPAMALDTDDPAPKPAPTSSTPDSSKKKPKAKKKKKKKAKDDLGTGSLDRALQPPYNPSSQPDLTRARAQIKAGEFRAAIVTLNRLGQKDDANVLNLLGYSHRKLGLVDVGMRYYLAALERNPEHRGVHEYLGEAYLQKDDLGKANIMLKKLGKLCGTDCDAYLKLEAEIADYKTKHSL